MSSIGGEEIHNRFIYHPPSHEGVMRHAELSACFENLAQTVDGICPAGREKSIVMTKLEEAKMWASAAVARNPCTR